MEEIEAIKKIIEAIQPLDAESAARALDYAERWKKENSPKRS